ncbi:MAG: hypothetical protein ACR2MP_05345 [Streptosporangiaceae bacterium]
MVAEPSDFAAFAHATDVLGADPYPCRDDRFCDWMTIPRYIAALRAAHVARYWGVSSRPFPAQDGVTRLPPSCAP